MAFLFSVMLVRHYCFLIQIHPWGLVFAVSGICEKRGREKQCVEHKTKSSSSKVEGTVKLLSWERCLNLTVACPHSSHLWPSLLLRLVRSLRQKLTFQVLLVNVQQLLSIWRQQFVDTCAENPEGINLFSPLELLLGVFVTEPRAYFPSSTAIHVSLFPYLPFRMQWQWGFELLHW